MTYKPDEIEISLERLKRNGGITILALCGNYTPTEKIFENSSREEKEKNTLLKSLVT